MLSKLSASALILQYATSAHDAFSNEEPQPARNMLDTVSDWLPFLKPIFKPNLGDSHGDKHAIDRGHFADHDFRLEFEDIV